MLTQIRGEPKVATRESGLPKCAQKRLAQLRALVDDYEAVRANLQKRMGSVRPDETMDRAEIERRMTANHSALSYARGLLGQVDDFLKKSGALHHAGPTKLEEAPRVSVSNVQWGRVEELRKRVITLKEQITEAERAPLPLGNIEAQLKEVVRLWAAEGTPKIVVDPVRGHVDVTFGLNVPRPHKIASWMDPDAMLARLIAQAKKQNEKVAGTAMPLEQKKEMLKKLTADLANVELEEVAMVDALQSGGSPDVQHRLNISPWALLGVKEPRGLLKTALVA
jgi:hypothetical protein